MSNDLPALSPFWAFCDGCDQPFGAGELIECEGEEPGQYCYDCAKTWAEIQPKEDNQDEEDNNE